MASTKSTAIPWATPSSSYTIGAMFLFPKKTIVSKSFWSSDFVEIIGKAANIIATGKKA